MSAASFLADRRRWVGRLAVAALATPALVRAAVPRAWPQRPLRLVVGFPGGSSADDIARTLAEPLTAALGQPVLVDNRPGQGGLLAARLVAQADDDHVAGLLLNLHLTVAPWLYAEAGYDPAQALQPVGVAAGTPLLLCASPELPERGAALLRGVAQAGAAWHYGSPGVGTPFHLAMELLKAHAGWTTGHVAYPGNPQVVNALLAGEVQLALLPPTLVLPLWRQGKLPVLGGTAAGVEALLPGVAELGRLGLAGFAYEHWYALAVPRAWSAEAAARLGRALRLALRQPALQAALRRQGWLPGRGDAAALRRRIEAQVRQLRPLLERHPSWRMP
ncbi:Tripartite tricarboxylate transporter family receptor [Tepidimonas sediminis]|uniref:Tripartite tricarboxylate transporter family receptor n=1 Tax=Tepidimonas sediminis TaxID=2588941 RepID=A0A554WP05_9BURK|nr:tripartite tricarboxylate transporter substrate binding protein [Tepidimonas sediminis]TSE25307.1 Tripartite tricarboxylate transporter family receptor [Tepidimonas sediminis]